MHPSKSDLDSYFTAKLDAGARAVVEAHLASCAKCRGYVNALSDTTDPVSKPLPKDPLLGTMLGGYRVLDWLGAGGMGALYRAEQPVIGKQVAIKVMLTDRGVDPKLVQRMIREARAVNEIRHGNIVDIFDFGELPDGRPYLVMELLEGSSLADMQAQAEEGRLAPARVLAILAPAMAALAAAHAVGVVHRDLKPDNIFCNPAFEPWKITLFDFGLARQEGKASITQPGAIMGTPSYMAPEQIRGTDGVSDKTDIYAMGVLAWTLLIGHEPFGRDEPLDVMRRHLAMPVPALRDVLPALPAAFEALVMRMMDKDPARRPTAVEVSAELVALGSPPVVPVPAAVAAPQRRGRLRWGILIGAAITAGLAVFALESREPTPNPVPAAQPVPVPPPAPEPVFQPPPVPVPSVVEPPRPTEVSLPCSQVSNAYEVRNNMFGPVIYFQVLGEGSHTLTITSTEDKGRGNWRKLEKLRARVLRCRSTTLVLSARHTSDRAPNKALVDRKTLQHTSGPEVTVEEVKLEAPASVR